MKKQLLIITQNQFGYHIDGLKYCEYLRDSYDIKYLCWDYNLEKHHLQNIDVIYIRRDSSLIRRNYNFIKSSIKIIKRNQNLTFIKYFHGATFLKIFNPRKTFILDIRTGNISGNSFERIIRNILLQFEIFFYNNVTFISSSLSGRFYSRNSHILPLGSDVISSSSKDFSEMNLLYVGTLSQRKILDSVKGYHKFYLQYKEKIKTSYTIIGSGYQNEEIELKEYIEKNNLQNVITLAGYIPHNKLKPFFDTSNIGISYIPLTEFFDCQPPTKTFEYILSGMLVLATMTSENKKVINKTNGVLIKDDPENFYFGLCKVFETRFNFNSEAIRNGCKEYTWKNIIENNLKNYIDEII